MSVLQSEQINNLRLQFPSLARVDATSKKAVVYLDGPAGTQVPRQVINAVTEYYLHHNANTGGAFSTSQETANMMLQAHTAAADFLNASRPEECIFGANMTTLTLNFSRAISAGWNVGDRVLVTKLDHDANVTPWALAARDRGAELLQVNVRTADATLDEADFAAKLNDRTKLVAFTAASNSVGSVTQIEHLAGLARQAGAEVFIDAVHWAPHRLIDVQRWNVDYCICSAYKFFGPHVGLFWGRWQRLEELVAYKLRPAPAHTPGKWMTGTQNFASIAGVMAAINYIASIANMLDDSADRWSRRDKLQLAMQAIEHYETTLAERLLEGLSQMKHVKVWGITDRDRLHQRVPTFALTIRGLSSMEVASRLAAESIYCWHGNYYAVDICEALGQSQHGMVRLGLTHINTPEEVDRTLSAIAELR